ncbi:response regulator [Clostridium taeniosporum]|uniref:Transcriptional regulatory protein n=1 Tax=Clostridium taeniosporum TaxID=394958 RepID=A0A1D7XLX8_9CLOT|nr:response regulator [Clostridium taeniosporum]AOR24334.1 two-component system response regulator [Clostridium taeniosporum]
MIKVLIVEDDPMVALINKTYLEKIQGIKIFGPAIYEKEIIDIIEKEEIDLILLDVFLPEKSGIEILKSLRSKKYIQDVIMITAANSVEELKMSYAYGVVDYLIKPFEFKRFEEAINKYKMKKNILSKKVKVNQEQLDSIFVNTANEVLLPKGLNKRTLDKIISFLKESDNKVWTLREISYELSISNVTIKKYMDYLESINSVWVEMNMGNIGRPEMKYYINL